MPRYPAARWRPVARYQPGQRTCVPMAAWRRYGLHTAVTSSSSLYSYFSKPGNATSHFFVDASGDVEQYIDTAFRSTAHLQGNHDTITVETQDMGGPFPTWDTNGSNVPAWTSAQVEALARLGAWLYRTHGIRLQVCPDSRPGSLGFAWHRQGVDPWRVSGGELWSKARGKVCPGDRRVAQVPLIVARAVQVAGGRTEDDMSAEAERQIAEIHNIVVEKGYIDTTLSTFRTATLEAIEQCHLAVSQVGQGGLNTRAMFAASFASLGGLIQALGDGVADIDEIEQACRRAAEDAVREVMGGVDEDGE